LAADLGMQVTLVESDARPGGTCLLKGCIPSKALLHVARVVSESREMGEWGVSFAPPSIDIATMRARKEKVIQNLAGGLKQLAKKRKVQVIHARATFENSNTLKLDGGDPATEFIGKNPTGTFTELVVDDIDQPADYLRTGRRSEGISDRAPEDLDHVPTIEIAVIVQEMFHLRLDGVEIELAGLFKTRKLTEPPAVDRLECRNIQIQPAVQQFKEFLVAECGDFPFAQRGDRGVLASKRRWQTDHMQIGTSPRVKAYRGAYFRCEPPAVIVVIAQEMIFRDPVPDPF
jgi:hypothetical protein